MRGKRGKGRTGEVADGDGDAGDGEEAEVVERAEVADDSREGRVPIQHRVLRLRRRRDVCVHLCAHASFVAIARRCLLALAPLGFSAVASICCADTPSGVGKPPFDVTLGVSDLFGPHFSPEVILLGRKKKKENFKRKPFLIPLNNLYPM